MSRSQEPRTTKVDRFLYWWKDHRWLSYLVIFGLVVGAIAGFVSSVRTLTSLLWTENAAEPVEFRKEVEISGSWELDAGDREMSGANLRLSVESSLRIDNEKSRVWLHVLMRLSETRPDYTEITGIGRALIFEAPPGHSITSLDVVGNKGVALPTLAYATDAGNRAFFDTEGTFWETLYFLLPDSSGGLDWDDIEEVVLQGAVAGSVTLQEIN